MKTSIKRFQIHTSHLNTHIITNGFNKPQINIFFGDSRSFHNNIKELTNFLSEKETERMNKFLHYRDKMCYLVVHALLKKQLSEKLNKREKDIDIDYFNNIKPIINGINLDFNISHSGHFFSFVIANNKKLRVGIDIEIVKVIDDFKTISTNYFSDTERAYIFEPVSDTTEQLWRFYEIWTCKESILKMIGIGLYTDLSKISVVPGTNIFSIEMPDNIKIFNYQAFIYSKRYSDFIVSVSLSEDNTPCFQKI
jgi:4'-phosphopantetheinyl transferase